MLISRAPLQAAESRSPARWPRCVISLVLMDSHVICCGFYLGRVWPPTDDGDYRENDNDNDNGDDIDDGKNDDDDDDALRSRSARRNPTSWKGTDVANIIIACCTGRQT